MTVWILDTDHVSLLLERHSQVSRQVAETGANVVLTIVTVQELFNGWIVRINAATELEDLIRLYSKLSCTIALSKRITVLDFDEVAAERYQQVLRENPLLAKKRLQKDMRIAAIALSLGATVVTRNQRDFSQVPGLLIEDWTQ